MQTVGCNILTSCTAGSLRINQKDALVSAGGVRALLQALNGEAPHPAANAANAIASMMYNHQLSQTGFSKGGCIDLCLSRLQSYKCSGGVCAFEATQGSPPMWFDPAPSKSAGSAVLYEKSIWVLKSLAWSIPEGHASASECRKMIDAGVCEVLRSCLGGELGPISQHEGVIGQCSDLVADLFNETGEEVANLVAASGLVTVMIGNLDGAKREFRRCKAHPVSWCA